MNVGNFMTITETQRVWSSETAELSTFMRKAMKVQFPLRLRINYMSSESLTILRKTFCYGVSS
jgi:hypothetical protein